MWRAVTEIHLLEVPRDPQKTTQSNPPTKTLTSASYIYSDTTPTQTSHLYGKMPSDWPYHQYWRFYFLLHQRPAYRWSHSFRLGGTVTLHLFGIQEHTIKTIIRWRSDSSLVYIQGQITSFTKGVTVAMSYVTHTTRPTLS